MILSFLTSTAIVTSASGRSSLAGPKHLVVDISAHGLGHVAQVAAVINQLQQTHNDDGREENVVSTPIRLTIRSAKHVEQTLRERIIHQPFDFIPYHTDNGMIMYDALRVDAVKTVDWYRRFHSSATASYKDRITMAAQDLSSLEPDLVFANIPYTSLDAASAIGVPCMAMCSLNWADVFQSYCCSSFPEEAEAGRNNLVPPDANNRIHSDMLCAYQKAQMFLQPDPSMPMKSLDNTVPISTLALSGKPQKELLRDLTIKMLDGVGRDTNNKRRLLSKDSSRFVLVATGGLIVQNFPLEQWPKLDGVYWVFPDALLNNAAAFIASSHRRHDFIPQSTFHHRMKYIDLLASCDLIITKTGYGTQTEAVVNQIPTICVCRHDWPEHAYLADWHERNGEVAFVNWTDVGTPAFAVVVIDMLGKTRWTKERVVPTGAMEAADMIRRNLYPYSERIKS